MTCPAIKKSIIKLASYSLYAYFGICISTILMIGLLSNGTTNLLFWIMQLMVTSASACLMLASLNSHEIPKIRVELLAIINVAYCLAVALVYPGSLAKPDWTTMATALLPWSALFWGVFYLARSLPWSRRFCLSAFAVLPATQLWYIFPPYMQVVPIDFVLWWKQPMFISMAESIFDSMKLYALPFFALALKREGWAMKKEIAIILIFYAAYCVLRLMMPVWFFKPTFGWHVSRLPMVITILSIVYFGLRERIKS